MFRGIIAFIVKTHRCNPCDEIQNFGTPQQGGKCSYNWSLTLRLLMSYMERLFLMFLDHTQTTRHSR